MSQHSPTVSVVMSVYNGQTYLPETIDSILAQTFRDFEFVIVDDGSTDETPTILHRYACDDSRVRVIRTDHAGIVDGANRGMQEARAELIARMDADDIALPHRFQRQIDFLNDHPEVVAVGSRMLLIDPYGSPLWESDHKLTHEEIEADLLRGLGFAMPQPSVMLRKNVAMKVGAYRKQFEWSEDLDLFLRMAEAGKLAILPDILLKYRQHLRSTNKTKSDLQNRIKRELLIDAHARRGKKMPENLNIDFRHVMTVPEQVESWLGKAIGHRNIGVARKHARHLIRVAPFRLQTWRMTYHALMGK